MKKSALATILVWLGCFPLWLTSNAFAVVPPPDGCYPNGNVAEGCDALFSLTTGDDNTAIGNAALHENTTGDFNTATGFQALVNNTIGDRNTANGLFALRNNTTGGNNTANGAFALFDNATANNNTAIGASSLQSNTTGGSNTATGATALASNTSGWFNTANGISALSSNTTGGFNTATGNSALYGNTTGRFNTATGGIALSSNTIGSNNTACGYSALAVNSIGLNNTGVGYGALLRNTRGGNNIGVGVNAGSNLNTGSNNIDIGNAGVAAEANTIRIGVQGSHTRTFIAGISGSPITGTSVVVNTFGRLGTAASSQRFKDDIKPMDEASQAIHQLEPVTFRYKEELDPDHIPQFGLVAEQVEKVNPDLVVRGEDGKVNTVRYEAVNAMLLNEFLKEHRRVAEQQGTIAELKTTVAQQQKQIEALTASVRKVSERVALSAPAPQIAANGD